MDATTRPGRSLEEESADPPGEPVSAREPTQAQAPDPRADALPQAPIDTSSLVSSPILDLAEAAIGLARRGFRVLPVHSPARTPHGCSCSEPKKCGGAAKHPRIKDWQNEASADPEVVARWWVRWRGTNVGLAMGGPLR